jgi:hypothetical protein
MEPPLMLQALRSQLTTEELLALIAYEEEILYKSEPAAVPPPKVG